MASELTPTKYPLACEMDSFTPAHARINNDKVDTPNISQKIDEVRELVLSPLKAGQVDGNGGLYKEDSLTGYFAAVAIEHMIREDITTGTNVAFYVYEDFNDGNALKINFGKSGYCQHHSEVAAFDSLPDDIKKSPRHIHFLFTLRSPCKKRSDCNKRIKLIENPSIRVIFNYHHPLEEDKLQLEIKKLGVRDAKKRSDVRDADKIVEKVHDFRELIQADPQERLLNFIRSLNEGEETNQGGAASASSAVAMECDDQEDQEPVFRLRSTLNMTLRPLPERNYKATQL
jgi:hypothetical protein